MSWNRLFFQAVTLYIHHWLHSCDWKRWLCDEWISAVREVALSFVLYAFGWQDNFVWPCQKCWQILSQSHAHLKTPKCMITTSVNHADSIDSNKRDQIFLTDIIFQAALPANCKIWQFWGLTKICPALRQDGGDEIWTTALQNFGRKRKTPCTLVEWNWGYCC